MSYNICKQYCSGGATVRSQTAYITCILALPNSKTHNTNYGRLSV